MPSILTPPDVAVPYYQIAHALPANASIMDLAQFLHGVQGGFVQFVSVRVLRVYDSFYSFLATLPPSERARYAFVSISALLYNECIRNGLESELAAQLLKYYSEKAIGESEPEQVRELCVAMSKDFTLRMNSRRFSTGKSVLVSSAIEYIIYHLNEKLTVRSICDYLKVSDSTLCHKFKNECGISIRQFILSHKIEASKELLLYSKRSCTEISETFQFSSPSHFSTAFRQHTGMTPNQFAQKYRIQTSVEPESWKTR